jgi:D-3-phosphoglycerate dehydrogenase
LQVAEQMSDYLLTGAVSNALNMPSVTAEEAKVMGPWIKLGRTIWAASSAR